MQENSIHQSPGSSVMLEEIANVMAQGIVVFGDKNIDFVSDKAVELLGVPSEVLKTGRPWMEYLEYLFRDGYYGDGPESKATYQQVIDNLRFQRPHQLERETDHGLVLRIDGVPNGICCKVSLFWRRDQTVLNAGL